MAYPYGRDIDSHCRTKCPKSRRVRCHGRVTRVVSRDEEGITSIFWDAESPKGCDHPQVLVDDRILAEAVASCVESMEPVRKLLGAIHEEESLTKRKAMIKQLREISRHPKA